MYLKKENLKAAAEFLNGPLWEDFKRCLLDRRPNAPDAVSAKRTQIARGFERSGFEKAIEEIEKLPFEVSIEEHSPFNRAALSTAD